MLSQNALFLLRYFFTRENFPLPTLGRIQQNLYLNVGCIVNVGVICRVKNVRHKTGRLYILLYGKMKQHMLLSKVAILNHN